MRFLSIASRQAIVGMDGNHFFDLGPAEPMKSIIINGGLCLKKIDVFLGFRSDRAS